MKVYIVYPKAAFSRNQREKDIESFERVYTKTVHNPHHS